MSNARNFRNPMAAPLHEKIRSRQARVGVIGLGYVGLSLAVELARTGFTVAGIDVKEKLCSLINSGESHVDCVPNAEVAAVVNAGRLSATANFGTVRPLDIVCICVPTPLDSTKSPDLEYIQTAAYDLKAHLRQGMLVVLESTTYPGTTEELLRRILDETGLEAGVDYFLAYAPERVDPGVIGSVLRPRVVGGLTADCSALSAELYGCIVDLVTRVSSPRAAEMTKLLENTFRAVNIGFINEVALMCEALGIDVWEVISAASTKPDGFMPFYPGPGLGGHCIPVDPYYLSWRARKAGVEPQFIELAGRINDAMPQHVVDKIAAALKVFGKALSGSKILIMGVAYKRDVDDVRESPSLQIASLLKQAGAQVSYHDPYVPKVSFGIQGRYELGSTPYSCDALGSADCVAVLTDHSVFNFNEIVSYAKTVVDVRNAVTGESKKVYKLGVSDPQES